MNIFFTNINPTVCADEHCIVHTRKMIIEYAQLLSTTHHVIDGKGAVEGIYKLTHQNHPSAKWVRISGAHYKWLYLCFIRLCDNYTKATGKTHKTDEKLRHILSALPKKLKDRGFIQPPQAMPEEFKGKVAMISYRKYIKAKLLEWSLREKPINNMFYQTPAWY